MGIKHYKGLLVNTWQSQCMFCQWVQWYLCMDLGDQVILVGWHKLQYNVCIDTWSLRHLTSAEEYPDEEYLDISKSSSLGNKRCQQLETQKIWLQIIVTNGTMISKPLKVKYCKLAWCLRNGHLEAAEDANARFLIPVRKKCLIIRFPLFTPLFNLTLVNALIFKRFMASVGATAAIFWLRVI